MALVRRQHQGNLLTTGYQTLQTASSGLATLGYILRKVSISNVLPSTTTGVATIAGGFTARNVDVHLVADSSSAVLLNRIASISVAAADVVLLDGPWWATSGATLQARIGDSGASSSDVALRVSAFEETTG